MATVTNVVLLDSLDERIKSGVETVTFFDPMTGQEMEIELGEANRKHFTNHIEKLQKYIDAARKVEAAPKKAVAAQKGNQSVIREWAKANGFEVGDRGRIKADIVEAYHKAQVVPTQTVIPEAETKAEEIAVEIEQARTEEPVKLVEVSSEAPEAEVSDNEQAIADALASIKAEVVKSGASE